MARSNVVRISAFTSLADDLQSAVEGFLACCRSKNLSDRTVEYYAYRLQAFERFLADTDQPTAPRELTTQVIREFLAAEADHKSSTTASHSHITLSAFFGFLVGDGFLESNPMENVGKPKRKKTVINTFTTDQVDEILATCGKDFIGARDRAIVLMLIDCGLRACAPGRAR